MNLLHPSIMIELISGCVSERGPGKSWGWERFLTGERMKMDCWITQNWAHDSSVMKGTANDLPVFGPGSPLKIRVFTSNLSSMNKETTDKPNHQMSPGDRSSRCLGRFDGRGEHGRGLVLGAVLMLCGRCPDPTPQISIAHTLWCPLLPGMLSR